MHNLEQSITEWRDMMTTRGVVREKLDELEDHLRENVEHFVGAGMTEAEAFQQAVAALGPAPAIASEFRKLAQSTWLPVKVVIGLGLVAILLTAIWFVRIDQRAGFLLASHVFTATLGYVSVFLTGLLGICFVCQRSLSEFSATRLQSLSRVSFAFAWVAFCLTTIGVVLGAIWARIEWGRFWAWDPKEIGGLSVFVWLICFLCAHRLITARGVLVISVVGNVVVSLGWFGANLLSGLHSYGTRAYSWFLLAVVIFNLLAFLVGFAPAGWLRLRKA